jgi:hypothetical protein
MALNTARVRAAHIVCAVLLAGCAQVAELSGGPKDEAPPALVRSSPEQGATGYDGRLVVLEFDERIQLDRVRERLLVSPPLDKAPVARLLNARTLAIELSAPLQADRTYTFGIGEAVKDLTEGNHALGLDLVFSTGDRVDSLSISGTVRDAFSGEPRKDVLVLAYSADSAAAFLTGRPEHATRSAPDGSFALRHLREGSYLLRALVDLNANYRYDLPSESIAFHGDAVQATRPDSTQRPIELLLFREEEAQQRITDQRVKPDGQWMLAFAREAGALIVEDIARTRGTTRWEAQWNARRDTVELWPSDTTALRTGTYRIVVDGVALDTLAYRPLIRMPMHTGLMPEKDDGQEWLLRSTRPVRAVDGTRFLLRVDSSERSVQVVVDTSDPRLLRLGDPPPEGTRGLLTVLPAGVRDLYGGANDTIRIPLHRSSAKELGTLRILLPADPGQQGMRLLQLLDGSGRVLREARVDGVQQEVVWERIAPASCTLRVIADRNSNGHWDPGSLMEGRQPERVHTHGKPIQVRAAWDLRVDMPPLPTGGSNP